MKPIKKKKLNKKLASVISSEEHPSVRYGRGVCDFKDSIDKLGVKLSSDGEEYLDRIFNKKYFDIRKNRRKIKPNMFYVFNISSQKPHIIIKKFVLEKSAKKLANHLNKSGLGWYITIKGIEALLFDIPFITSHGINTDTEKLVFAPKRKKKKIREVVKENGKLPSKAKHFLTFEYRYEKLSLTIKRNIKKVTNKDSHGHVTTNKIGIRNLHRNILEQYNRSILIYQVANNSIEQNRLNYLMFKYDNLTDVRLAWSTYKAFKIISPGMVYPFVSSQKYLDDHMDDVRISLNKKPMWYVRDSISCSNKLTLEDVDKEFQLRGYIKFEEFDMFLNYMSYIVSTRTKPHGRSNHPEWIYPIPFKFDAYDINDNYSFTEDEEYIFDIFRDLGISGHSAVVTADKHSLVKLRLKD